MYMMDIAPALKARALMWAITYVFLVCTIEQAVILARSTEPKTIGGLDSNMANLDTNGSASELELHDAETVEQLVHHTNTTYGYDFTTNSSTVIKNADIKSDINYTNHGALFVVRYLLISSSSTDLQRLKLHVKRTAAAASHEASAKVMKDIAQRLEVCSYCVTTCCGISCAVQ
jgi:hypothetical protein